MKLNCDGDIQEMHDLYASRETELIGQVESLRKDLNAEMIKHRLTIEVNENLEQTKLTLQREIESLKARYDPFPIQIYVNHQLIFISNATTLQAPA